MYVLILLTLITQLFIINYHLFKDIKENATCQGKYFPFSKNESTKKGIILQEETVFQGNPYWEKRLDRLGCVLLD